MQDGQKILQNLTLYTVTKIQGGEGSSYFDLTHILIYIALSPLFPFYKNSIMCHTKTSSYEQFAWWLEGFLEMKDEFLEEDEVELIKEKLNELLDNNKPITDDAE